MSPYREMKLMAEASESNRLQTQAKLDRVTAEREALQRDLEQQKRYVEINANSAHGKHKEAMQYRAERDALQQRLTAADERVDVLAGLLLQTNELLYAIQGDPGAVPSSGIDAMRGEVFTALKSAEGGGYVV